MWPGTVSTAGRVGLVLLAIWAITNVTAGVYSVDPIDPTHRFRNDPQLFRDEFPPFIPAIFLLELDRRRTTRPSPARSLGMLLALAILIAAILLFTFNGPLYRLGIGGAVQRLYWIP
jgi:hypothetical protein